MSSAGGRAFSFTRLLGLLLVLFGLYLFRDNWLPPRTHRPSFTTDKPTSQDGIKTETPEQQASQIPKSNTCRDVPGANNVMVLLKTGATELYSKLPSHFVTTFKCIPHYMIFSDLAQDFGDHPVHDALAGISQHFRDDHRDFELYRKLQQYQREGQDMGSLQGSGSWNLDKWKFLPMLHSAFTTAGENIEWFVVMEADTSLSWTNLLQWLKTMDPQRPYYMGAQNIIGNTLFAHGGSGIVISRKAADLLEEFREQAGREVFDAEWERVLSVSCCGDEVIARTFGEVDVHLTPAWPLIQGETIASLDWTANHWCTPPVTWHHVSPIEIDSLWQFESDWIEQHGWDVPYLFRDVFDHFISRHVTVNRTAWNNLSKDRKLVAPDRATPTDLNFSQLDEIEQKATMSADACVKACEQMPACVQWMFSPGRCHLGKDIRFGKSDEHGDEHWTSGWMQDRISQFRSDLVNCDVKWSG